MKEEPRALLVDLRTRLIKECCALFQEYQGKIPFERRKQHTKIEDIYIIGYSVVSKIAHKNLAKIFRNFETSDTADKSDESGEGHLDFGDLLNEIAACREQINQLTATVSNLNKRVETVEAVLTEKQILELETNKKEWNNEDTVKKKK